LAIRSGDSLMGSRLGYDLGLVEEVAGAVQVPVIVCGGAGRPLHFLRILEREEVSAAAAANYFHFTEHSVALAKSALHLWNVDVRLDSDANYVDFRLTPQGRLLKQPDDDLLDQFFEYIEEEVI